MMVYHFLNHKDALDDLRQRRLKIATIMDLNDPFEFLSVDLSDREIRKAFNKTKKRLSKKWGLLCFSKSWSNPVQWSHYADSHKGACLGFEVPDTKLIHIIYSSKRMKVLSENMSSPDQMTENNMENILKTKYSHWRYEQEVRVYVGLKEIEDNGLYFCDFGTELKLKKIIVGARSKVTREMISEALGDFSSSIESFKSRAAFKSFRVIPNKNETLWL